MVIANNNQTEKQVFTERFNEMLVGKSKAINIISNQQNDLNQSLNIPAKSVIIYEIK